MIWEDKKISVLSGVGVLLVAFLLGTMQYTKDFIPVEIVCGFVGFIFGWLAATWVLKIITLKESKQKTSEVKQHLIETSLNPKSDDRN